MKLTYLLFALFICATAGLTARAEDYDITDTGTITSFQSYAFDGSVADNDPLSFSFAYDDTVPADYVNPPYGAFYPSAGAWTLTFGDYSYSGVATDGYGTGVQVLATTDGDYTDGVSIYLDSADLDNNFLNPEADFVSNTPLPNEDLSNVQTVLTNFDGTASFTIYGGDEGVVLTASLDNPSVTAVPEPSTWSLLAGGMVLAWLYSRRRNVQGTVGR